MMNTFSLMFNNVREKWENFLLKEKFVFNLKHNFFVFRFQREQLAAVTAIANHHRLSATPVALPTTAQTINEEPDVNVVDMDDTIDREEKSTSGTTRFVGFFWVLNFVVQ